MPTILAHSLSCSPIEGDLEVLSFRSATPAEEAAHAIELSDPRLTLADVARALAVTVQSAHLYASLSRKHHLPVERTLSGSKASPAFVRRSVFDKWEWEEREIRAGIRSPDGEVKAVLDMVGSKK